MEKSRNGGVLDLMSKRAGGATVVGERRILYRRRVERLEH